MAGRSRGMVLSFVYWSLRRLLELVVLRFRSEREKEIEILLRRHQLRMLQRQVARPALTPADRALLGALSRVLPRDAWKRSLFVRRRHSFAGTGSWLRVAGCIRQLARENPSWGYGGFRAARASADVGGRPGRRRSRLGAGSIPASFKIDPNGARGEPDPEPDQLAEQSWTEFLRQAASQLLRRM